MQIDNLLKKKSRGSTKIKARFVSLPELRKAFETEEVERREQERANAEKEAQKTADTAARNARIFMDTTSKVFDSPLSSYKLKDDLRTITGALGILTTGTVAELSTHVKEHLNGHPELVNNPRFSGLYQTGRRRVNHTQVGTSSNMESELQIQPPPSAPTSGPHLIMPLYHDHYRAFQPIPVPFHSQSSSVPYTNEATYNSLPLHTGSSTTSLPF